MGFCVSRCFKGLCYEVSGAFIRVRDFERLKKAFWPLSWEKKRCSSLKENPPERFRGLIHTKTGAGPVQYSTSGPS